MFENKEFRKIFGAKRDEITGEWRKLHNAQLRALCSPNLEYNSDDLKVKIEMYTGLCLQYFVLSGLTTEKGSFVSRFSSIEKQQVNIAMLPSYN